MFFDIWHLAQLLREIREQLRMLSEVMMLPQRLKTVELMGTFEKADISLPIGKFQVMSGSRLSPSVEAYPSG